MKKRDKKEMSINEAAELYKTFTMAAKEASEKAAPYKDSLLDYAGEHPEQFEENTLKFMNGVRIERRESTVPRFESVDYEWVGEAIEAGLGPAVSLTLNAKALPEKQDKNQKALLKQISYKLEKKQTLAVCLSK